MKYVRDFVIDGVVEDSDTIWILGPVVFIHIAGSDCDEIDIFFGIDGIDFTFYSGIINANEICVGDLLDRRRMHYF